MMPPFAMKHLISRQGLGFAALLAFVYFLATEHSCQIQQVTVVAETKEENTAAVSTTVAAADNKDLVPKDQSVHFGVTKDLCPNARRMGTQSAEGGWFVCDPDVFDNNNNKNKCVLYSFGINNEWNFDKAMNEAGCEVHGYEPASDQIPISKPAYEGMGAHFHSYGLGLADGVVEAGKAPFRWPGIGYLTKSNTEPWTLKRIPTIMKELGHTHVSMLKIDVEGAEWDSWQDIIDSSWDVFATELHFPPGEYRVVYGRDGDATTSVTVSSNEKYKKLEPSTPAWLNRIPMIEQMLKVAEIWKIERNPQDPQCMNVYFKRRSI